MTGQKNLQNPRFRFKALYLPGYTGASPFNFKDDSPVPKPEDDNLHDWIRFYLYKEVIGVESKHTARAKTYDLHKLLVFFELSRGHKIALWDKSFTTSFIEALEKEYEISSVYRTFATITNFVNFLIRYEVIKPVDKPTGDIRLRDQELPPPKGVQLIATGSEEASHLGSRGMYNLLMSAAQQLIDEKPLVKKKKQFDGQGEGKSRIMPYRDAAIIALLYNTGLRADEVCSITMSQLDRIKKGGMWLRNVKCKGKRVRKSYVNQKATEVLLKYIKKERGELHGVVFRSWRGNRLNQPDIFRIVRKIALKAQENLPPGVIIDIHPHSLRHERAYNLKQAGLGDATIAEQLGHKGIGQVARYTRRTEEDEAELLKDI